MMGVEVRLFANPFNMLYDIVLAESIKEDSL